MKKIIFALLAVSLISCGTNDKTAADATKSDATVSAGDSTAVTSIQWLDSTHRELGKIKLGEKVEVAYRFKNTGNKNLVIEDVQAQCGCTVPEKPEKPIAPGEEGVIKAVFNSEGRGAGTVRKGVTVRANTSEKSHELSFGVEVTN